MGWPIFKNLRHIDRVANDDVEKRARAMLKELELALKHVDEFYALIPEDEHVRLEDTSASISAAYACIATIVPKLRRARGKADSVPDTIER